MTVDPDDVRMYLPEDFGPDPLPEWVRADKRWARQMDVVSRTLRAFQTKDVVFVQAPTGTGKTLIAEAVGRLLNTNMLYVCTTKALQDQFKGDFPYAQVLKGRSNYLTQSGRLDEWGKPKGYGESDITCADCVWDGEACRWCISKATCPYLNARNKALTSRVAVLNSSYLLTDAKGSGQFGGRGLVVLDECDLLEGELLNQFEVVIGGRRQAQMGLFPPKRKTVEDAWVEWVKNEALPITREYLELLPTPTSRGVSARDIREYVGVLRLIEKLEVLEEELPEGGWVYDGYSKEYNPKDSIIFRPVKVSKWGRELLWPHGRKFLLMSATVLSADMMADELGCSKPWEIIDVGSDFPVENRPVYIVPVANMAYHNREQGWQDMAEGVEAVLRRHPDDRVLVHCVSYELARYLYNNVYTAGRLTYTYNNSGEKQEVLDKYKKSPGGVLFAASMDRGIDLPDDLCRVQIIAKIPFPNIKDKRIDKRMRSMGGANWYRMQTIRTLVQMTGRGVRSRDDWAKTYVLDSQFQSNLWKSHYLFPEWWKEALNWKLSRDGLIYGR